MGRITSNCALKLFSSVVFALPGIRRICQEVYPSLQASLNMAFFTGPYLNSPSGKTGILSAAPSLALVLLSFILSVLLESFCLPRPNRLHFLIFSSMWFSAFLLTRVILINVGLVPLSQPLGVLLIGHSNPFLCC